MAIDYSAADRLVSNIRGIVDLDSLPPATRTHSTLVRQSMRRLTLRTGAVPMAVPDMVDLFVVYGFLDRAFGIATAVTAVACDGTVNYNYIRSAIHHAAYAALRAGRADAYRELEGFLRVPEEYWPVPRVLEGRHLRRPFERMDRWVAQSRDATPLIASDALVDLRTLSTMALFSPSPEWPRDRIDGFYDQTMAGLRSLAGWGTW